MKNIKPEDLLAKADKVIEEKGWCAGSLYDMDTGGHCALGAIGYAKFGKEFDEAAARGGGNGSEAYDLLATAPDTQAAMHKLANQIRKNCREKPLELEDFPFGKFEPGYDSEYERQRKDWLHNADAHTIMGYNDNSPNQGSRVRNVFAKAGGFFKKAAKKIKPVSAPLEVEYIPAEAEGEKETHKEIA